MLFGIIVCLIKRHNPGTTWRELNATNWSGATARNIAARSRTGPHVTVSGGKARLDKARHGKALQRNKRHPFTRGFLYFARLRRVREFAPLMVDRRGR